MTAPKLVLHAALAGLYGAAVLARFLWIANDGAAVGGRLAASLVIALVYAAAAGFLWALLYGSLRFFATRPLQVPWFSPRYLMAFLVVNTAAILAACWDARSESRLVLDPAADDRLRGFLLAVSLAWFYAAVISFLPRLRRAAWPQASAAGVLLAALLSPPWTALATPGAALPAEGAARAPRPARRLILLNFDGADLEDILTLLGEGKLPAFARLREEGAYGRLRSVRPCEAAVTRTVLATGKFPMRNGVRGGSARRLLGSGPWIEVVPRGVGFDLLLAPVLASRPLRVADKTALALWDIAALLGAAGRSAGWDVDLDRGPIPRADDLADGARRRRVADLLDADALREKGPAAAALLAEVLRAADADAEVLPAFHGALADRSAGVSALSFPGLDAVAHAFLRYARRREFGNVTTREIELYGGVLEGYYRRVDAIVGQAMAASDRETVLFVTSSHGIDPVGLPQRLLSAAAGKERRSGAHDRAPGGFLFARGPEVQRGVEFGKGWIADVVPTALYALNLPIAGDLDGSIRAGVFTPLYTFDHPVTVIATYEPGG